MVNKIEVVSIHLQVLMPPSKYMHLLCSEYKGGTLQAFNVANQSSAIAHRYHQLKTTSYKLFMNCCVIHSRRVVCISVEV